MKKIAIYLSIFGLLLGSIPLLYSSSVSAQSLEGLDCNNKQSVEAFQDFLSLNDIPFYDPCSTTATCSVNTGTVSAGAVSSLKGSNNGQKIYNFWLDAGLSPQQAAGVTGSIQHESGFSAFRQETSKGWPAGGWGIAQFTAGQRDAATAFVKNAVGESTFNQYYSNSYGGAVTESNGFVPSGVPAEVNDAFLLAELNYLLEHIQGLNTSSISVRVNKYKSDFNVTVSSGISVYEYLKTLTQPSDAAIAWTYLYEYPANIKTTATARGDTANNIATLYSGGTGTTTGCGGNLSAGGMTLEQAKQFMEDYKNNASNEQYIGTADKGCAGGPLSNCVSFSMYFINKYTSINGQGRAGNGSVVVANLVANNAGLNLETGNTPRPYAVFSTPSGSQMCGNIKCGHTGVILGVDTARGKVIVGEAGCSTALSWDTAREYDLSQFDSPSYNYVYTDGFLKGAVQ